MPVLFRHYDRAALEAQFVLSGVDDLDALFARRQQAAEAAAGRYRVWRGVSYGPGRGEMLDIYAPDGAATKAPGENRGRPVQLFIHGGFWRSLDAALFAFVADGFVPKGAIAVILDYPLIPTTDMAGVVAACFRALSWLRRHVADYGGDPGRIHISGNSAGGHLVAELAHPRGLAERGLPPDTIASVTAISGLFELEPVRLSSQNDTLALTPEDAAQFSPQRRLEPGHPPMLVTVGGLETAEFLRQSRDYAEGLRALGDRAELLVVPDANHITIVLDHLARPGTALNSAILRLMGLG
ncbi:MAG: alpha/beta hydrolase [Phycisphaerales bacterium]